AEKRAVHTPPCMIPGTPSPDGRLFPCSQAGTGNLALYEFATGESRILTKTGDGGDVNFATESIVSVDGRQGAYGWGDGACECSQLRVIDADGAHERTLYGAKGMAEILPLEWSSDGRWILGTRRREGHVEVILVSTSDGTLRIAQIMSLGLGRVTLSPD